MKRNEILGEHKKGTKAVKYNKKLKDHAAEFGKAKEKLAPVKPMEGYNPNSAGAEHRRKLDQSHAADLKARAEGPDATERDQQRYQSYLDKKEQMRNDYNDRMEREGVGHDRTTHRGGKITATSRGIKHEKTDYEDDTKGFKRKDDDDTNYSRYKKYAILDPDDVDESHRDSRDSYQRDYDFSQSGFGDQGKREFKRREMEHELGHETNNYAVAIDGRTWKVFASKNHAQAVARSLQNKGKKATVHETGAEPTAEAMGAEVGKITKVDPTTKKATLTKTDGSSMEVDSTALKPTPDGKMSMDTPDADELKMGTAVVSTEDMTAPTVDSSSPINGDEENVDLRRLRELAGELSEAGEGMSDDYLQKAASGAPGRWMISQDKAKEELARRAAGGKQNIPSPEPDTSSAPFVPKDYQTKEPLTKGPDGKWYNKAGQERDNLHGGPIGPGGGAMFRSLTPRAAPTPAAVPESSDLTAMLRIAGLR